MTEKSQVVLEEAPDTDVEQAWQEEIQKRLEQSSVARWS
jgi:hypothetical protein